MEQSDWKVKYGAVGGFLGAWMLTAVALTGCGKPATPDDASGKGGPLKQSSGSSEADASLSSERKRASMASSPVMEGERSDATIAPVSGSDRFPLLKAGSLLLVDQGNARSAVVVASDADEYLKSAVDYFVKLVEKSTGAKIPIVDGSVEDTLEADVLRIYVGNTPQARELGLDGALLPDETFRIVTCRNALFVVGSTRKPRYNKSVPRIASRPTLWALKELLEGGLGVRWLWPGELGTYVPKQPDFAVAAMNMNYQPKLESRILRISIPRQRRERFASRNRELDERIANEAVRWAEVHQCGARGVVEFGHNFGHWWDRYSKDHPDYFAELPPGREQPFPSPKNVKLRLANPKVVDQIVEEYKEAGCPDFWNMCPNDGSGFDISAETCAWDIPQNQNPNDIFGARGNLTARYVRFWNLVYERLKEVNPDVTIVTYAYSSYRLPPPPEVPLKAKAVIQFVDGVEAFEGWRGWAKQGVDIYLRPNWWHQGAAAPYLTLDETTKYLKFAFENRMLGLDMDSILGNWATQGTNYYLVARLMTHPELSKEEILDEYTSAFGKGASRIRDYIAYWEGLTKRYFYPINAGDVSRAPSEFQKLVQAGKIPSSILNGSTYVLPYLYPDSVLAPAEKFLTEAEAMIGTSDPEALQRIAFLRRGLDSMRATRDQVVRGQELKKSPIKANLEAFLEGEKALQKAREEFSKDHTMWGEYTTRYEERYRILLRESALQYNEVNLDGM